MNFLKHFDRTVILFFTLICLIVVTIWFKNGNLFLGAEEGVPFYNLQYTYNLYSAVWLNLFLGIPYLIDITKIPFFGSLVFLNNLGIPSFFLQVLTFFVVLFGGTVSFFFLIKASFQQLIDYRQPALFGSLFYLFNTYSIGDIWSRGIYNQFFAYLYFPLFLLCFVLFLQKKSVLYLILGVIVSFILSSAMGNPSYTISLWIMIGLYQVVYVFNNWKNKKTVLISIGGFLTYFLVWVLINSWWLVIFVKYASSAYLESGTAFENSLESLKAISSQVPFVNTIRLFHAIRFGSDFYGQSYENFLLIGISWLVPLIAVFSVYYIKLKPLRYYYLLFLTGLFICLGSNPPFGKLFLFLFKQIAIFQVFRNPYEKFGLVFLIGYSCVFGLGLYAIIKLINRKIKKIKNISFIVISTVFLLVFGFLNWPMWNGEVIGWGTQVEVPSRYQKIDKWLSESTDSNERVFFLPYLSSFGAAYQWIGGVYHGNDPLYQMLGNEVITQSGTNPFLTALRRYSGSMDLTPALALLSTNYLVVRPDVKSSSPDLKTTEFLTESFYEPNINLSSQVCRDSTDINQSTEVKCNLSQTEQNLATIKYIHLLVKADRPGYINLQLLDNQGKRSRWNGIKIADYQFDPNTDMKEKWITVFVNDPSESGEIDLEHISAIEVQFNPLEKEERVFNYQIKKILVDSGIKRPVEGIIKQAPIEDFSIYQMAEANNLKNIQNISDLIVVNDFHSLFEQALKNRSRIGSVGFLIPSQNKNKVLPSQIYGTSAIGVISINKFRYQFDLPQDQDTLMVLNQSFNSEWKVIKNVSAEDLTGSFFGDINLLRKPVVEEKDHLVVNGYANVWYLKKDSQDQHFAIVYKPQIVMDILWKISLAIFGCLLVILMGLGYRKYAKK